MLLFVVHATAATCAPATTGAAGLAFADCLAGDGFHQAATQLYIELEAEPSLRTHAINQLTELASWTGDRAALRSIVDGVDSADLTDRARDERTYERVWAASKPVDADIAALLEIPESSITAPRARLLAGVLLSRRGKSASARDAFLDAAKLASKARPERITPSDAADLLHARGWALLGIANLNYGLQRFEEARTWATRVPRGPAWDEAQLLVAWTEALTPSTGPLPAIAPGAPSRASGVPGPDDLPRGVAQRREALRSAPWALWMEGEVLVAVLDRDEEWCGSTGPAGDQITTLLMGRYHDAAAQLHAWSTQSTVTLADAAWLPDELVDTIEAPLAPVLSQRRAVVHESARAASRRWRYMSGDILALLDARDATLAAREAAGRKASVVRVGAQLRGLLQQAEIIRFEHATCCLREL